MQERKRILLLIFIMFLVSFIIEAMTITMLYKVSFDQQATRLEEIAKSHSRLIEAVARFDKIYSSDYPEGSKAATLSQITDAHNYYEGFGKTGEFTISEKIDDKIVFILKHRHYDHDKPKPVNWNSKLAEPMRLALSEKSGVVVGLDYRGTEVLAAYEFVKILNIGVVAKIDLAEIRKPYLTISLFSFAIGVVIIIIAAFIFIIVSDPIIKKIYNTNQELTEALNNVKKLSGLLPICASCKKIRNDEGYWNNIETYIREHSEANFTHSLCPDCVRKLYPDSKIGKQLEKEEQEKKEKQ